MKDFNKKVIVITGAASGIGWALTERFAREGAYLVLSDLNKAAVKEKAAGIGAPAYATNVAMEDEIKKLVENVIAQYGHIDMFISNAGIAYPAGIEISADKWKQIFDINVLSHVNAAKYAIPHMLERGEGYLLNTASAAGLLVEFDAAPYTVTKHAAVGFSEWLSLNYKDKGIRVSVLCPAAVRTPMTTGNAALLKYAIEPEELVDKVIAAISEERFMISTHDFVDKLFQLKGNNYEEYMKAMQGYHKEAVELKKTQSVSLSY
jgi:NAD(P)-dependent dehydrogenase (short-subunit alcohol dehydrogenase family)